MELDFHTEGPQCKPGSTTSTTDQLNISSLQFLYEMGEHVAALQLDMRIKQTIFYTYTHSLFYQRGLKSSILISESYDRSKHVLQEPSLSITHKGTGQKLPRFSVSVQVCLKGHENILANPRLEYLEHISNICLTNKPVISPIKPISDAYFTS